MSNLSKTATESFWYIKHFNVFRNLEQADADALARITTFKRFETAEQLHTARVYLLKEGRVKIYHPAPTNSDEAVQRAPENNTEAKSTTVAVLESGEIFGINAFENDEVHPKAIIETLTDVVVGTVNISNFRFFLKRKPHLAMPGSKPLRTYIRRVFRRLIRYPKALSRTAKQHPKALSRTARQLPSLQQKPNSVSKKKRNLISDIAFRSPESRVALLLQHLAKPPTSHGIVFADKLSPKALSRLIGCTVDKTEALLEEFKQHNVIKTQFRKIQLLDIWRLKKIADARCSIGKRDTTSESHPGNNPFETGLFTEFPSGTTTSAGQTQL